MEAVDSPAGGDNHSLAKKIAKDHPVNNGRGKDQPKHHPSETPVGETTKAMVESSANHPEGSCQLSGTVYAYSNMNIMTINYLEAHLHAFLPSQIHYLPKKFQLCPV